MDEEVEKLLKKWGLGAYIAVFRENKVDEFALKLLEDYMIRDLIKPVGDQAKFKGNLEIWRAINGHPSDSTLNISVSDLFTEKAEITSPYQDKDLQATPEATQDIPAEPDIPQISQTSSVIPPLKTEILPHTSSENSTYDLKSSGYTENGLHEILNKNTEGKSLLAIYKSGNLDSAGRNKLCNIIIKEELKDHPDKLIPASKLIQWSREICQIFPKENRATYYLPYVSYTGGRRNACGKLHDCYHNKRKEYRKAGLIKSARSSTSFEPSSPSSSIESGGSLDDEENADTLAWLENSSQPWDMVVEKWQSTAAWRMQFLKRTNSVVSVAAYMNKYAALKHSNGYLLLIQDFNFLYPKHSEVFNQKYPIYVEAILTAARRKLHYMKDTASKKIIREYLEQSEGGEEGRNIAGLLVLPFLISNTSTRQKKWRPSKIEVRDGFMVHLKSNAEVLESVKKRKEKLEKLQITVQPYMIIVGENLNTIKEYFIVVDNVFYKAKKVMRAVDTCFKIIHALHACYQAEAMAVWMFIQKALYSIHTSWDREFSSVNEFISEVGIPIREN